MAMNKRLGSRLCSLRRGKGWTQEQAAQKLGVTRTWLLRAESGLELPDAGMLARMAQLYGMSVNEMLEGTGQDEKGRKNAAAEENASEMRILRRGFPIFCTAAFLVLGLYCGLWRYAWLVFFAIPLFYSAVTAARERDMSSFAYPVLALQLFLLWGLHGAWSRAWLLLVTIPVYYYIAKGRRSA